MLKLRATQFDALDAEASELLAKRGFALGKKERGTSFGSHSSEYERGKERVTLYYDGRDNNIGLIYVTDTSAPARGHQPMLSISLSRRFSSELDEFRAQIRERINAI